VRRKKNGRRDFKKGRRFGEKSQNGENLGFLSFLSMN
jgi:hypothetical protein